MSFAETLLMFIAAEAAAWGAVAVPVGAWLGVTVAVCPDIPALERSLSSFW